MSKLNYLRYRAFEKDFLKRKRELPSVQVYFCVGTNEYPSYKLVGLFRPLVKSVTSLELLSIAESIKEVCQINLLEPSRLFLIKIPSLEHAKEAHLKSLENIPDLTYVIYWIKKVSIPEPIQDHFKSWCKLISADTPSQREMTSWFMEECKELGFSFSDLAQTSFLGRLNYDMLLVDNELKKLAVLGIKGEITSKLIEEVVPDVGSEKYFDLMDLALKGDKLGVIKILEDVERVAGIEYRILAFLARFWEQAYLLTSLKGRSIKDISDMTGLHHFLVRKLQTSLDVFDLRRVREMLGRIVDLSYSIRSYKVDAIPALENYFLTLTN